MVRILLEFLKTGDYYWNPDRHETDHGTNNQTNNHISKNHQLLINQAVHHTHVYAFANRLATPVLKLLALECFDDLLVDNSSLLDRCAIALSRLAGLVYEIRPDTDRGLRSTITRYLGNQLESIISDDSVREAIHDTEGLVMDLLDWTLWKGCQSQSVVERLVGTRAREIWRKRIYEG